jgi:hypothetical protein
MGFVTPLFFLLLLPLFSTVVLKKYLPCFVWTARSETIDARQRWQGTIFQREHHVVQPGHSAIAPTTVGTTTTSACAPTPDIPGLVHAQYSTLFVLSYITFFSPNTDAPAVARIQHAPVTFALHSPHAITFGSTRRRKQHSHGSVHDHLTSAHRKGARNKLTTISTAHSRSRTPVAPFAT